MTYTIYHPQLKYSLNQQTSSCIYEGQLTSKLKIIHYKHTVYLQFPQIVLHYPDWNFPELILQFHMILDLIQHRNHYIKCSKFNSAVNTTSELSKTVNHKKLYLNARHHAYSFCLQHLLKNTFSSGVSRQKKFLTSDDTAESQSCFKRKLINKKKNRVS